jgi:hypothetical protein
MQNKILIQEDLKSKKCSTTSESYLTSISKQGIYIIMWPSIGSHKLTLILVLHNDIKF